MTNFASENGLLGSTPRVFLGCAIERCIRDLFVIILKVVSSHINAYVSYLWLTLSDIMFVVNFGIWSTR